MNARIPIIPVQAAAVRTTCPYCGVGCGVVATPRTAIDVAIAGDETHPANFGRLCVKGSALGDTVSLEGRLLKPKLRDGQTGALADVSWSDAIGTVASGFARIVERHGPDAVAFYVSGQLLTEDYYVANKLMKGYIGSANIDTNSRLCMSSSVAGHKRAFGEDLVPLNYEDLELADTIVLVGSNTAWCHPILFQRIVKMKEARPDVKIVVIDPRHTATCEMADLHLPLKPGSDVRLFNGLFAFLAEHGASDSAFVDAHTNGFDAALAAAGPSDLAQTAKDCKLDAHDLMTFYRLFARTERVVTVYSQGVNQSSAGTDKVNSIINCHLLTGRIGKPGMGPFSFTGQPNAMGGREVGGLANTLAAHLELDSPLHREIVQTFWASPAIPERAGLKAVDLFNAIEAGRVKAVWIMGTNPVVSLPDGDRVKRALAKCELVVSSDIIEHTDTNACADVLLPALGWGEKDGTVTNSERRISRQRAFLPAPGEARADWRIMCDVARRMGFAGFDFQAPHEIFDEHARLSAYRNDTETGVYRAFDIGGLTQLGEQDYDLLEPVQWPLRSKDDTGSARLFEQRRFSHADGRARFIATPPRDPVNAPDADYPLILNTGRVRDQWHTMTRTGRSAKLAGHISESFIDMHPQDALAYGVREGELARVTSRWGSMIARVQFGGGMSRGSVFVPIHWNDQVASDARVGAVVNPVVDPVSGEPEFKHTPVSIEQFHVTWHGFALSRRAPALDSVTHWTRVHGARFVRHELAGRNRFDAAHDDHYDWARALFRIDDPHADWIEYEDKSAGVYRAAHVVNDRIESCVFVSERPDLPARAWLASLFDKERLDDEDRASLLLGQPIGKGEDTGPTVCSCFGVGRNTICKAIQDKGLKTAAEVTACVKAGGNCGSCVPELKKLIVETEMARLSTV
ncbi:MULTISPECIES: molybdopterin-dependent oxidoreductase [unclassified Caballeronia]|uniref:molybdopterin-dependent oxidoreductase n=1 Tax=unclassified Caballeronia TaxID=2646786 RepID=UPI0028566F16|nr:MULTISPECIES: molybdopterin-dependent oxidoreductase [unclassified Caballeronia]MDR5775715.1 molybdopterin-dependent oxidoreductase [Caballeronia sp. LZ002]MDR5851153.1 molybdopterin-dependent oxidoreductase [Caballeronia sp. LZ003]